MSTFSCRNLCTRKQDTPCGSYHSVPKNMPRLEKPQYYLSPACINTGIRLASSSKGINIMCPYCRISESRRERTKVGIPIPSSDNCGGSKIAWRRPLVVGRGHAQHEHHLYLTLGNVFTLRTAAAHKVSTRCQILPEIPLGIPTEIYNNCHLQYPPLSVL